MVFSKHLREGIRRGRIRCSVRIWTRPHVKAGGRYRLDEGDRRDRSSPHRPDIIYDRRRVSFAAPVICPIAKHGSGDNVYLIGLRYIPGRMEQAGPPSLCIFSAVGDVGLLGMKSCAVRLLTICWRRLRSGCQQQRRRVQAAVKWGRPRPWQRRRERRHRWSGGDARR